MGGWVIFSATADVKLKFAFFHVERLIRVRAPLDQQEETHLDRVRGIMSWLQVSIAFILIVGLVAQAPDEGYSREQLLPLTKFRQQHRRTIDGRFC